MGHRVRNGVVGFGPGAVTPGQRVSVHMNDLKASRKRVDCESGENYEQPRPDRKYLPWFELLLISPTLPPADGRSLVLMRVPPHSLPVCRLASKASRPYGVGGGIGPRWAGL